MILDKEGVFRRVVTQQLNEANIEWEYLVEIASQIVLFGSRACKKSHSESDWDILIISRFPDHALKIKNFDIIWIDPSQIETHQWLGSELANHVAKYGVLLHGKDTWSSLVYVSAKSIEEKRTKIRNACSQLIRVADDLEPLFIERRIKSIRRDLQRLEILLAGFAVPPTPDLDQIWDDSLDPKTYLLKLLKLVGINLDEQLISFAIHT